MAGEDIDKGEDNSRFGQEVCLSVFQCLRMVFDSLVGGLTR